MGPFEDVPPQGVRDEQATRGTVAGRMGEASGQWVSVETPTLEASISTTNWRSGSGTWRMGADVNLVFKELKAASAAGDHQNGTLVDVRAVSGAAMVLYPRMNLR